MKRYLPLMIFFGLAVLLGIGLTLNPRELPSVLIGKPAPQFESSIDERFILGLVKLEERTLILMNLEALMGNAEMGILA